jgi:predicted AAA+ superfamily ATPase
MKTVERSIFPALKSALEDSRIIVLTGMRRVGKTTALRWLLEQVESNNKIYLDMERLDQREVFQEKNYDNVIEYLRNRGLDPDAPMTVALDEIQFVPNLPSVIKYLYDHYAIKFLLTGSSSFYLKNQFTESLSGRKVIFEMFPLTFGEFLDFRGISYQKKNNFSEMAFDKHEFERLNGFYEEYLQFGGLPNVVLEPKGETKREILSDILSSYINIDVRGMADFRKIGELEMLLRVLANRIGNKLDMTKLSKVVGISRPTLYEYIDFLEKTYVISLLSPHGNPDKAVAGGKKLYFRDNGIASLFMNPGEGALFENALFNQLQSYGDLSYLGREREFEIDFVIRSADQAVLGLEAKIHPVQSDLDRLAYFAGKYHLQDSWLVGRFATPMFDQFIWGGSIF